MKKALITLALLCSIVAQAQDFKQGYALLEVGKFAEGAAFFSEYLHTGDSTNRTALLCYGRGIGLSSSPAAAQRVFQKLLRRFPDDLEIKLNWAESLMWNKQYAEATTYYEALLVQEPTNFNATVGYANALSALKKFEQAVAAAQQAQRLDPANANLKITLKYGRLGWASQLIQAQQYTQALPLLEAIVSDLPNDADALFLMAQMFTAQEKYAQAEGVFQSLTNQPAKQTNAYLQLAYLSFLQKKPKAALIYAEKAQQVATQSEQLTAQLGRVNALGWNNAFKKAFALIDSLEQVYPKKTELTLARARLSVWSKQYAAGARLFKLALNEQPNSFDANLGYADACHAQDLDQEARKYAQKTLEYYPNQRDASQFLERISLAHAPQIGTHTYVSSDNGGNQAVNINLEAGFDVLPKYRFLAAVGQRTVNSTMEGNSARIQTLKGTMVGHIAPFYTLTLSGNQRYLTSNNNQFSALFIDVANAFKIGRYQTAELRYATDVQTFTANLVDNDIRIRNYIGTYNLATPVKVGLYSQYIYSQFSDGNHRQSMFASLYYDLSYAPVAKVGINAQTLHFEKRVSRIYFSPFQFRSFEVFGQLENLTVPKQQLLYQFTAAFGGQQIEEEGLQPTYRLLASVGYRVKNKVDLLVYGSKSNAATSTVVGYSYQEIGVKGKWTLYFK